MHARYALARTFHFYVVDKRRSFRLVFAVKRRYIQGTGLRRRDKRRNKRWI
jgi:hypothetical protein